MGILDRQAREIPYDDSEPEPVLRQDPEHPHRWSYTSPAVPLFRVRLERGMRGAYSYEVTAEGTVPGQVLEVVRQLEASLRAEYGRSTNTTLRGEYGQP